jgi:hypothetical protein
MPLYALLLFLSVAWTIYHTLMQKMGLLRIYSRKGTTGSPLVDRLMVFVWFFALLFFLASKEGVLQATASHSSVARMIGPHLVAMSSIFFGAALVFLMAGIGVTAVYLRLEFSSTGGFSWPRNLFMLSTLTLYGIFLWDVIAGYAIMGFSHAVEYLAFVVVFSRRKYAQREPGSSPMASWAHHATRSLLIFALVGGAIFAVAHVETRIYLGWYIVGSSFLHFLYDGWIWKVRKKTVSKPLGIA